MYVDLVSQGAYAMLDDVNLKTEIAPVKNEWLTLQKYLEKIEET